ncbi:MAG TPA: ABC transporter ATP-binding protein [Prosthecobacter sp.]|nr:ABC transporter ATP-binding protein [Prosthecobacter sp.]HRK16969.1 ABC transporter ATP-binding protein [Prosthecobacter sp.]
MPEPVLAATDLHRSYALDGESVPALRGVSLEVAAGDFIAVTGPSGCGKSTLLQLCGVMDRADAGTLRLDGRDVSALSDNALTRLRRDRIGFVFQFFNLLPTLSLLENIAMPLLLARQPEKEAFEKARALAERVGIAHRLAHFPAQVSGGEAQRAALARAVVHEPALLIADEPTGSLDSENGRNVLDLFRTLNRDLRIAILLATHDPTVAAAAQRQVRMKDGRIV